MYESDKALASLCADILSTTKIILLFQFVVFTANLAVILNQQLSLLGISAFLVMIGIVYYGIRLTVDTKIFRAFSQEKYNPQTFDNSFATLFTRTSNTTKPRSMSSRCRGAIRLYRNLILLSLLHTILLLIALWQ